MNMLSSLKLLHCDENRLQFIAKKELTLFELQSLFHASKKHWNQCTDFNEPILYKGQCYTISFKPKEFTHPVSFDDVTILYEDCFVILAFKPPFLLVHDDGHTQDTLQARIDAHLMMQGAIYPCQAIHRIDYEASGLLLFSKHPFFQPYFDFQMQQHQIKKEYQCIVEGKFPSSIHEICKPIGKDRHQAKKMRISKNGKPSKTIITAVESNKNASKLTIEITTGRKHQIRVHLASLGYPIYNDPLYGVRKDQKGLLLQSHKLSFKLPFQKQSLQIECPDEPRMCLKD